MDTYYMTDQPECCRKCGARTTFVEMNRVEQEHTCPSCGYKYILEADTEEFEEGDETICCDCCNFEYHRHVGDICPACGNDNHEQFEEKYGFHDK